MCVTVFAFFTYGTKYSKFHPRGYLSHHLAAISMRGQKRGLGMCIIYNMYVCSVHAK